jgi:hypothetical protein
VRVINAAREDRIEAFHDEIPRIVDRLTEQEAVALDWIGLQAEGVEVRRRNDELFAFLKGLIGDAWRSYWRVWDLFQRRDTEAWAARCEAQMKAARAMLMRKGVAVESLDPCWSWN